MQGSLDDSWSGLLLEGIERLDEDRHHGVRPAPGDPAVAPETPAERVRAAVESVLGNRAGKLLALVPAGDPDISTLRPVLRELERFTRLFIGRDEAKELADRLETTLDQP